MGPSEGWQAMTPRLQACENPCPNSLHPKFSHTDFFAFSNSDLVSRRTGYLTSDSSLTQTRDIYFKNSLIRTDGFRTNYLKSLSQYVKQFMVVRGNYFLKMFYCSLSLGRNEKYICTELF